MVAALVVVAVAGSAARRSPLSSARVELRPSIVGLEVAPTIVVSGVRVPSLQVLLFGASDLLGHSWGWQSLRLVNGRWVGELPMPGFLGVYPVYLRVRSGGERFGSPHWILRVLDPGTGRRPSFQNPFDVARWWVRAVRHRRLVAVKAWPRPAFDHRDPRLHRLFIVAYAPYGDGNVLDRLGMFITAYRHDDHSPWRLLEATAEP
jgi:hypothetical protein